MRRRGVIAAGGTERGGRTSAGSSRGLAPSVLSDALACGRGPVYLGSQLGVDGFARAIHVERPPRVLGSATWSDHLGKREALLLVVAQGDHQASGILGA